jgi:hypothetical protein
MTHTNTIIDRIRKRSGAEGPIGVRGVFPKAMELMAERTVRVIANTDDIDLQQEVVVPNGADTSYFFANGNVFVDHQTDFDYFVGKRRRASPYPNNRDFKAWQIDVWVRPTELGNDVLTMAQAGAVGVSIGFIPTDWGRPDAGEVKSYGTQLESIVRRWKWLELSFTAFPCNVACQSQGMVRDESKAAAIEELLTKGAIKMKSAEAVGFHTGPMPVRGRKIVCRL